MERTIGWRRLGFQPRSMVVNRSGGKAIGVDEYRGCQCGTRDLRRVKRGCAGNKNFSLIAIQRALLALLPRVTAAEIHIHFHSNRQRPRLTQFDDDFHHADVGEIALVA
jgi:hypothetical protein